jgi:hypothetical protein
VVVCSAPAMPGLRPQGITTTAGDANQEVANWAIKYSDRPSMDRWTRSDSESAYCQLGLSALSQKVLF